MWTDEQEETAALIVRAFENGRIDDGVYEVVAVLADGAGPSWGPYQMTLGSGNIARVLARYERKHGADAPGLTSIRHLLDLVGAWPDEGTSDALDSRQQLVVRSLKAMGKLPGVREAMDSVWWEDFMLPAQEYARSLGLETPLGLLVVLDLFNQSGVPRDLTGAILGNYRTVGRIGRLRARFNANPPSKGGDEREFAAALNRERWSWLSSSRKEAVRKSTYRTAILADLMEAGEWDLELPLKLTRNMSSVLLLPGRSR